MAKPVEDQEFAAVGALPMPVMLRPVKPAPAADVAVDTLLALNAVFGEAVVPPFSIVHLARLMLVVHAGGKLGLFPTRFALAVFPVPPFVDVTALLVLT